MHTLTCPCGVVELTVRGTPLFAHEGGITEVSPPGALLKGERLCFSACDGRLEHDVVTSPLSALERMPKDVVAWLGKARDPIAGTSLKKASSTSWNH